MKQHLRYLSLATLLFVLSGCSSISYYQQAAAGHLSLMSQRQSIDKHLANPATPKRLRNQLKKITALRHFAEQELVLRSNGQYSSYVDLKRPYVVWNVFAAPELSLQSKSWCYLIVGCAGYRGYYSQQDAHKYAKKLQAKNMDVYVAGITAYSTLGWFNDPVLNTFVYKSDTQLAKLIFHELAHQRLYVKNDSVFNESFATVIAHEGVKRWLLSQNDPNSYEQFLQEQHREKVFVDLVLNYRQQLATLYDSDLNDDLKRIEKIRITNALRHDHQQLKMDWGGQSNYDSWFEKDLNNAQLNTVATYHDLVPALQTLLAKDQYDLNAFYRTCQTLADQTTEIRNNYLSDLSSVQRAIDSQPSTF